MLNVYTSPQNRQGLSQVIVKVRTGQLLVSYYTGIWITPSDYSRKKKSVRIPELNTRLQEEKARLLRIAALYRAGAIDVETAKKQIKRKNSLEDLLKEYAKEKTPKSYKNYTSALKALKITHFADFNDEHIAKALRQLEHLSPYSRNSYLRHVKAFLNEARLRGYTTQEIKRTHKQKTPELMHRIPTVEEIAKAVDGCKGDACARALLCYLVSVMTRCYYSDLKVLKEQDIPEGVFDYYRHKTGVRMPQNGRGGLLRRALDLLDFDRPMKYSRKIRTILGVDMKSARKLYETTGALLEVPLDIRFRLLGHTNKSIKRYYTNWDALTDNVSTEDSKVYDYLNISIHTEKLLTYLDEKS